MRRNYGEYRPMLDYIKSTKYNNLFDDFIEQVKEDHLREQAPGIYLDTLMYLLKRNKIKGEQL